MVTKTEVQHIADLAKLEFGEKELDSLTSELNKVLVYIDQLKELDVDDVPPLENLNELLADPALRIDEAWDSLSVDEALRNAPAAADGYFLVPKVMSRVSASPTEQAPPEDEAGEPA